MVDAVCGYPVFSSEKVGALYVEPVDILALIFDASVLLHIDPRHSFEHIANASVLFLGECPDGVADRIALLSNAVGLDGHFL